MTYRRLSPDEIDAIKASTETLAALAERYGVSDEAIRRYRPGRFNNAKLTYDALYERIRDLQDAMIRLSEKFTGMLSDYPLPVDFNSAPSYPDGTPERDIQTESFREGHARGYNKALAEVWTLLTEGNSADAPDPIMDAYGRYDSDPRVNGPEGYDAFCDAVAPLIVEAA